MTRPELPAPLEPDPAFPTIRLPDGPAIPSTPLEALMMAAPNEEPVESLQEMREKAALVSACVDSLPDMLRRLIEMHVYEGLSFRDIEQAFGDDPDTGKPIMSKSSAQRHVQRALDQLRETLVERGLGSADPNVSVV